MKCPGCKRKRVVGGELDYDLYEEKDCIMMFGFDYCEERHKNLPVFEGIKVEEKVEEKDESEVLEDAMNFLLTS